MDKNQSENFIANNISSASNPSKLQEARFRKAMQNRIQNLALSNVIGLTSNSKHNMLINPLSGELYYIAGSTIVVYNIEQNVQKKYIQSPNKRNIVCICLSKDCRYLAAGEGTSKQPEIIIWDLQQVFSNNSQEGDKPLKQLKGHKIGLKMLFFSPNLKYIISIGDENDKGLFVWDWVAEERITLNKMSKVPLSACFSEDGTKFITCGEKYIKLWQFHTNGDVIKTPVKEKENAYIIEGRSINLGSKMQEKTFTDCEFDKQSKYLYVSTSTGQICIVDESRIINKFMDIKVQRIFNIAIGRDFIICSCSDNFIRVLRTSSLDYITSFPKMPPLLQYNVEKGQTKIKFQSTDYSDAIGLVYDDLRAKVSIIYSDRSLFIWDITQFDQIAIKRSFLNHSGGINDLQILNNPSFSEITFFMTTSTDKTARIWHEISTEDNSKQQEQNLKFRRNVYSKNLSRIIYLTNEIDTFKFKEQPTNLTEGEQANQEVEVQEYPTCIKSTQDGSQIILANNKGHLIFMNVSNFEVSHQFQAHDKEISCMDLIETPAHGFLATGGRDRQIKIFDLKNNNKLIFTIDDHSSSIVALKFAQSQDHQSIYLISAATDRQIIFREYKNQMFVTIHREVDKNNKINSLDISSDQQTLYVGFDKKINSYSVSTGKPIKQTETKEDEKVSKTYLDNLSTLTDISSSYIASFNQDKVIRIRDCQTMAVVSKALVGDTVTGMGFTINNSHLITSTSEGLIYIWKMSSDLKNNIDKKKQQLGIIAKKIQDFFKQEGQNMLSTKDLNLGSFWIEEEMRQYMIQQQKQNQNVPLQIEDQFDPLKNLKPTDLMKNTNLPNWAKTKPTNNNNQQQQKPVDEDNLLQDFKDRIFVDKKINNFQDKKTNNFIRDSEYIQDSINARHSSQIQQHQANSQFQSKLQQQGYGLDSINERDYNENDYEDQIFSKNQVASIIGYNNQNPQLKNQDGSPQNGNQKNQNLKIEDQQFDDYGNQKHIYIDDNKIIGLQNASDQGDSDGFQYNSDHLSQFLKQDQTIPVSSTQAQMLNKLANTNITQLAQQKNELEVEEIYSNQSQKHLSNQNSNQSLKSEKEAIDIKYKKDNGKISVFDVDHIQGQLQKVEHNLKQAENNFKFKDDQINIFQSSNQQHVHSKQQIFTNNNLINSININNENQVYQFEEEHKQLDGLIMLDDEEELEEDQATQKINKLQQYEQKQDIYQLSNSLNQNQESIQSKKLGKDNQEQPHKSFGVDLDQIQIKDQSKQNTLKSEQLKQDSAINTANFQQSNKQLSAKNAAEKKFSSINQLIQQKEEDAEIIYEEIENNQSSISMQSNQALQKQKQNQWLNENKMTKESEKIQPSIKVQSTLGDPNTSKYQKKTSVQEEINDEFDESYIVCNSKEFQQYQSELEASFKIILDQLNKIEDIVENKLDHEPVSIRKKVCEKVQLRANKIKASLQNINYKTQQASQQNVSSQFNISYAADQDFVKQDLLENYSKLLLEAVLKRK
ncbi:hypothetical protein ABPG74_013321 [Tetrahymena malaccensis]